MTPHQERETLLHRWVADGKVEAQALHMYPDLTVTEYRVPGTKEWWRDEPSSEGFPGAKLIATLALGIMALQPNLNPPTPQWQHAWAIGRADDWKV